MKNKFKTFYLKIAVLCMLVALLFSCSPKANTANVGSAAGVASVASDNTNEVKQCERIMGTAELIVYREPWPDL